MYDCKILADSISAAGHRLTSFEVTAPRIVLAEINTHRMLSRNSASSRAIPVCKAIKMVEEDPFIPASFHKNQKGMQAEFTLEEDQANMARHYWQGAMDAALDYADGLERLEVHKGLANRILEPFKWHTIICTATDWANFFALRTHENAQAEIRTAALMMQEAMEASTPQSVGDGAWHLPLVTEEEIHEGYPEYDPQDPDNWIEHWNYWKMVSVGRCARVSYLTHHGVRDPDADVELATKLMTNGHLSPFEHVARPFDYDERRLVDDLGRYLHDSGWMARDDNAHAAYLLDRIEYQGNLRGWHSSRMDIPNENNYAKVLAHE